MTIKAKVFLVLGLILAVAGTSTAVTLQSLVGQTPGLERTQEATGQVANEAVPLLVTILEIKADVIQVQQWLTDISATRGLPGFDDGFTEAEGFAKKFSRDIATARKHAETLELSEVLAALKEMEAAFPPFYAGGKKMAQAYIKTGPEGGNPMMEEFDAVAGTMGEATDKLVALVQGETGQTMTSLQNLASDALDSNEGLLAFILIAGAVGAVVIIAGVIAIFVTLTSSFGSLHHDVQVALDESDQAYRMSAERRDEFGPVAKALVAFRKNRDRVAGMQAEQAEKEAQTQADQQAAKNRLADEFESSVGNVVQGLSSASTELQSSAQTMSATAEQTNSQAASVASAAEHASTNVQTVAAAAEQLSGSIHEISRQVAQSTEISMAAVEEVTATNEKVQGLAEAASKIGEVVALITDIADQTNLLALNATIEAARAGDAGKGFAVVASEVKNLANQTAKATEEIGAQISGIQEATDGAVSAIGNIGKTITQVSEIASAIAAAVEEQGAATSEIARNVEQASAGTQEVSSNISGVTEAAGKTGHAASQILGASNELSQHSETLRQEVDNFIARVRAG